MHVNYKLETGTDRNQAFPKRAIFFRDGVSEGQFKQVIDGEIPKIKGTSLSLLSVIQGPIVIFTAALADMKLPTIPKLTVVVVGKRHHGKYPPLSCFS